MFKNVLTIIVFVAALAAAGVARTQSFMVDGIRYEVLTSSTCKVIPNLVEVEYVGRFCSYSGDIVIPSQVTCSDLGNTYKVTEIGDFAFTGCTCLTSVTIPESVTSIGHAAFGGCIGLTSVNIPNSVSVLEPNTFTGCINLTSVILPNSVTEIRDRAFEGCFSLKSITIPNSVTVIGETIFWYDTSLTKVTIGSSVDTIGTGAFYMCQDIDTIVVLARRPPVSLSFEGQDEDGELYNAFYGLPKDITVIVPCESVEAYRNAEVWSEFTNIQCQNEALSRRAKKWR